MKIGWNCKVILTKCHINITYLYYTMGCASQFGISFAFHVINISSGIISGGDNKWR